MDKVFFALLFSLLLSLLEGQETQEPYTFQFNATSSAIMVPAHESLDIIQEITLEAWIKASSFGEHDWENPIISRHGQASGWELRVGNREPVMMVTLKGEHFYASGGSILEAGKWYHLVGLYDGNAVEIYVNGLLKKRTLIEPTYSRIMTPYLGSLSIGQNSYWNERQFSGFADEIRIWNRVLSKKEIQRNFHERIWNIAPPKKVGSLPQKDITSILKFRLVANDEIQEAERKKKEQEGINYQLSAGMEKEYKWYKNREGTDLLIETLAHKDYKPTTTSGRLYNFNASQIEKIANSFDSTGQKVPLITLKKGYRKDFGDFTARHKTRYLAVIYNDVVIMYPVIRDRIPGQIIISGLEVEQISKLLALIKATVSLEATPDFRARVFEGDRTGLVLYYNFIEFSPAKVSDLSPAKINHGTYTRFKIEESTSRPTSDF